MSGAGVYTAAIDTGDVDAWTFTACAGEVISLSVTEAISGSPLSPWLRLYGWNGELLRSASGAATAGFAGFVAPASGTYTVVVGDGNNGVGGAGTYELTVNGLIDQLRLCSLALPGAGGTLMAIGGGPSAPFVLLTTTDLTLPLELWTPVLTNAFDVFGVVTVTNLFDPEAPRRFYVVQEP
jgi:hypothetical protein